jgi:hypothetical protein
MIICTGITPNYLPQAKEFIDSAKEHSINPILLLVDFAEVPKDLQQDFRCLRFNYSILKHRLPKFMLQHGGFTEAFPNAPDSEVVAFVDADARWQRPITDVEYGMMDVQPGVFMAGRNHPNLDQTLAHEATLIFPVVSTEKISQMFPGHERMFCRNWGFVVAQMGTWRQLYKGFSSLWSFCDAAFHNPAKVQWLSCYVAQLDHTLVELPLSIHAHGHCGIAPGIHKLGPTWYHEECPVLFAHKL